MADTPKTYKQIGGFVAKNYPTLITAVVFPSMKQRIKRSDIRFIETVVLSLLREVGNNRIVVWGRKKMNVKARMFKNNRQVMLYLDIKGTSDLDCPYIDIDTGWVNRIFKHFPGKAWNNTIINMNMC